MEIWKDIEGYEGFYQINCNGHVKSLRTGKTLKPGTINGYYSITLCVNFLHKSFLVHRLIAKSFIPNPDNKPCINHKDGNRKNNALDNLEWCTQLENVRHAFRNGLVNTSAGEKHYRSRLKKEDVLDIIRLVNAGGKKSKIAKQYNITNPAISRIIGGYVWKNVTGINKQIPKPTQD